MPGGFSIKDDNESWESYLFKNALIRNNISADVLKTRLNGDEFAPVFIDNAP